MRTAVITHNEVTGFHSWADAPKRLAYLASEHRHNFVIECWFKVDQLDRQIEVFEKQDAIEEFLHNQFGIPCRFGGMSCEMIAYRILRQFKNCIRCEVREDGLGGAAVEG